MASLGQARAQSPQPIHPYPHAASVSFSSSLDEQGMKFVASAGTISMISWIHPVRHASQPEHFSLSITTSPSSRVIASNLHLSMHVPRPIQPYWHSPFAKPAAFAASQLSQAHAAKRSFPAEHPAHFTWAIIGSTSTGSTPRICAIPATALLSAAGHSVIWPLSAIASAQAWQVG